MKVIFLDVDGVLNCANPDICKDMRDGMRGVDKHLVERLNTIVRETGAVCVLSSTWRLHHTPDEMENILDERGFIGILYDVTPNLFGSGVRGREIDQWLRDNNRSHEKFVILDDNSDMWPHEDKLVLTRDCQGLSDHDVRRAIAILNEE